MKPLYDSIGKHYGNYRTPDTRIAAALHDAIRAARTVVNIGAGAGSYEPSARELVAVEPSSVMITQRSPAAAPVVQAHAEALPFADGTFDAGLAILTIHHWTDVEGGLREARRVVAGPLAVFTHTLESGERFWLLDYLPQIATIDRAIFPSIPQLQDMLGPALVSTVPIPHDCTDGFLCAYWRRPRSYLDAHVRSAISTFSKFEPAPGLDRLREDLESGAWARRYGHLLERKNMDLGYRLVVWN